MLISRAIYIENENVNLEKDALKQLQLSWPAYEHPSALSEQENEKFELGNVYQ